MPKTHGRPDSIGATYEGDVLNGKLSVQEAFERDRLKVIAQQARRPPDKLDR